ncbi:hypothetical protein ACFL3A_00370 [Pseudomonadota bacterium]
MPSMIRIEIYAGLCNRMRVLDSAIQLAKRNNCQIDVIWNLEKKFNCKFDELFMMPQSIRKIDYQDLRTLSGKVARTLTHLISVQFDNRLFHKDINRLRYNNTKLEELTRGKTTFISTDSDFIKHSQSFKEFVVKEPLAQVISSYTVDFKHVVGVHIRRGDHKKATKYSPTTLFIKHMEMELTRQPESRFFLATDSPEVEAHMVGAFGNRIITHPKCSRDRNNPDAIKDALIDLYCLASCKKILGSFWSSFTNTASKIYGAEATIIKST